jgi:hypothetical protein
VDYIIVSLLKPQLGRFKISPLDLAPYVPFLILSRPYLSMYRSQSETAQELNEQTKQAFPQCDRNKTEGTTKFWFWAANQAVSNCMYT